VPAGEQWDRLERRVAKRRGAFVREGELDRRLRRGDLGGRGRAPRRRQERKRLRDRPRAAQEVERGLVRAAEEPRTTLVAQERLEREHRVRRHVRAVDQQAAKADGVERVRDPHLLRRCSVRGAHAAAKSYAREGSQIKVISPARGTPWGRRGR
jgi:hypothetical protein